jgi:hypothetical protein
VVPQCYNKVFQVLLTSAGERDKNICPSMQSNFEVTQEQAARYFGKVFHTFSCESLTRGEG